MTLTHDQETDPMTDTATRPAVDSLPGLAGDTLPEEIQPAPPAAPTVEQTYAVLPIDAILPSPHNPRRELGDLDGLVASIRAVGLLEPLLVEVAEGLVEWDYTLLAGHRRHEAAKRAGLTEVPCMVRKTAVTPALRMEMALIENLQREGLAPLDEADGYLQLTKLGMSQRVIADRVGCSQSHVSKRLALLELPTPVQKRVEKGTLTLEAAAALTRLKDHPDKLKKAADEHPSRIAFAVERAEQEIAWEAKVADLRATAKAKGWKIIDEPRDRWLKRSFKTLAKWDYYDAELALDVRKHQVEPCHAVMIPQHQTILSDKPSATSVCTDPARHGPKGASKLKCKLPRSDARPLSAGQAQEREDSKQRKLTGQARVAVLAEAVAAYTPPRRSWSAIERTLRATLSMAGSDEARVACQILGLSETTVGTLRAQADGGDAQLHRAAFATALASVESRLRWNWSRWTWPEVPGYFAYLAELGYTPSPWEQAKLDEAKASEAAEGEG